MPVLPKEILFGRMAVARGFLTKEQLEECVAFQKQHATSCPLGLVMIDKGYLTSEQLQTLVDAQKQAFQTVDPLRLRKIEDSIFGQIAIKENMVVADEVNHALRDQALDEGAGRARRIGEILVERGYMSEGQVQEVLEIQRRRTLVCSSCGAQFNIEKLEPGKRFKCGKCQTTLEVPARQEPAPPAAAVPDLSAGGSGLDFPEGESAGAATGIEDEGSAAHAFEDHEGLRPALGRSTIPEDLEPLENKPTGPNPAPVAAHAGEPAASDEPPSVPEEEGEGIEALPTMAMPSIRAELGGSGMTEPSSPASIENRRTIAMPAVGRVTPPAPPPAAGGLSEEDLEEVGLEGMQTMAMPGLGHLVQKRTSNPATLENLRTMAMPGVGRPAGKGIDPNATITFDCSCGRRISAPAKMAGRAGKCPGCGKKIMLPKALAQQVAGMAPTAPKRSSPAPATGAKSVPARSAKAPPKAARPAQPAAAAPARAGPEGTTWEVTFVAGSQADAKDAGIRGAGTFTFGEAGLVFSGAGRSLGLLTFAGAPLCLAAGGAALFLHLLPPVPAVLGGVVGALALASIDFLLRRARPPEPISVGRASVKRYKAEPKPRISFALSLGLGEAVCVTLIPQAEDRKTMLQMLAEAF